MRRKGLGKLYDRLTPEERFRLDVLATARGDEEESRRLTQGCPRHSYTLNDIRFSWRWEAARELTMVMLLDLNQHLSKLRMIDALRSVLPYGSTTLAQNDAYLAYSDGRKAGSRHTWKKAGMKGEPPGWEEVEEEAGENGELTMEEDLQAIEARVEKSANFLPELLSRLERKVVGEALPIWEAFARFCEEEMALEAEKVLAAIFEPALENVRWLEDLAKGLDLEPEHETVEEYRVILTKAWNIHIAPAV
jgi:hypothetical protein